MTQETGALPQKYEQIVEELGRVVERLESGTLSLEEAIEAFEQGVKLSRAGARKLDEAEKRIEILLEHDRVQPFEPSSNHPAGTAKGPARGAPGDPDIPF